MDRKIYDLTVRTVSDPLYRFSCKLCRDSDKAKDLVQECFIRLWQCTDPIEKPKAFLFQTAYRLFIDDLRHEKTKQTYAVCQRYREQERENNQKLFPEQNETKELIEQALLKLPPDQKSVIMLRDYEGYSYQEISQITGLSEAQVKTYIFRARTTLRKLIGKPENILS